MTIVFSFMSLPAGIQALVRESFCKRINTKRQKVKSFNLRI
jgi:hypothetical protein